MNRHAGSQLATNNIFVHLKEEAIILAKNTEIILKMQFSKASCWITSFSKNNTEVSSS